VSDERIGRRVRCLRIRDMKRMRKLKLRRRSSASCDLVD
jgi:hypothetical protein